MGGEPARAFTMDRHAARQPAAASCGVAARRAKPQAPSSPERRRAVPRRSRQAKTGQRHWFVSRYSLLQVLIGAPTIH